MSSNYLEILKASYDYEPQSEDEIALKDGQILLLLEKTDGDWWKVKVKDFLEDSEGGLVPAAYVEQADHSALAKALYDYDANAPGELTLKEHDILLVYDKDEDWWLVKNEKEGKIGFVPGNYLEETTGESESTTAAPPALQIIVPPSPPRPTSVYIDPADRVAASKATSDDIQTWSVSEVDKKGKKKKGTLGVGNGSIFFASESDKTPVQKWQVSAIEAVRIEKSKHVHIDVGGANSTNLHFNAGSKDIADAIETKVELSRRVNAVPPQATSPNGIGEEDHKVKKNGISVHFATSPVSIIPPRDASDEEEPEEDSHVEDGDFTQYSFATVLYDFAADGEDELSVIEGQRLTVLDRDNDEWWKCRDADGKEGVVPASYIEFNDTQTATPTSISQTIDTEEQERVAREARDAEEAAQREADRKAREKMEAESAERERKKSELERKRAEAERVAKATAEADAERKRKDQEAQERAEADKRRREERRRSEVRESKQERKTSASTSSAIDGNSKGRTSTDSKRGPAPKRTRTWHDRSGQFQVDAEFLGFSNGKIRLHKINGVVIEVPAEKMSEEDMRFIDKLSKRNSTAPSPSEDDEPLSERKRSLQPEKKPSVRTAPSKKDPSIDWFEFFLAAGCDVDDCTRYASSFEKDKIDESILSDITEQIMRSLGLREGDIIRVKKAIAQRTGSSSKNNEVAIKEQLRKDEELARQLHAEENGEQLPQRQSSSPAPNLFASPGGILKSDATRRKRPQPSKTPPINVDLDVITSASEQINTGGSSAILPSTSPTLKAVKAPPRSSSVGPTVSGFEDDPWTNRPSSTKPTPAPSTENVIRVPSAPPPSLPEKSISPAAPAPVASPPVTQASVASSVNTGSNLARTTESDVFDQLARLSQLRTRSPTATPPQASNVYPYPVNPSPPVSIQQGLGVGSSPLPLGQHLQSFPTGVQPQSNVNGPRGPYAPISSNQSLLQPLVPTATGFNGFIPTRPSSTPSFQPAPYQQQTFQQQYPQQAYQLPQSTLQPSSFLSNQPTGFSNSLRVQPTGFAPPISFSPPIGSSGSFVNATNSGGVAHLQPVPTGFTPSLSPLPFNNSFSSPPPANNNTSPANIFAQMRAGAFEADGVPQPSEKYDSLRPQPTGWSFQGLTGVPNTYGYSR